MCYEFLKVKNNHFAGYMPTFNYYLLLLVIILLNRTNSMCFPLLCRYDRVEILSGFINALFLVVISLFIIVAGVSRLIDPPPISTDRLLVCIVVVVRNQVFRVNVENRDWRLKCVDLINRIAIIVKHC